MKHYKNYLQKWGLNYLLEYNLLAVVTKNISRIYVSAYL